MIISAQIGYADCFVVAYFPADDRRFFALIFADFSLLIHDLKISVIRRELFSRLIFS